MRIARADTRVLAAVLTGWAGVTVGCAVLTRIAFAADARQLLKVHFIWRFHKPASESLEIWLKNSQATLGIAACIALVLLAQRLVPAGLRGIERLPFWAADIYLCLTVARTSVLAGVLLGAYGSPQLRAFLPYGPIEVLAWALLITIYIAARRGRSTWRDVSRGVLVVEALLALAGILETTL